MILANNPEQLKDLLYLAHILEGLQGCNPVKSLVDYMQSQGVSTYKVVSVESAELLMKIDGAPELVISFKCIKTDQDGTRRDLHGIWTFDAKFGNLHYI